MDAAEVHVVEDQSGVEVNRLTDLPEKFVEPLGFAVFTNVR